MKNVHEITAEFEKRVAEYTGAPYTVAVDNCSNALFLALTWARLNGLFVGFDKARNEAGLLKISIPSHTYPAVPCEIIHAGFRPHFEVPEEDGMLKGEYQLIPTNVWDSALRFTSNMYRPGQIQCLSFTGPKKHLKLGKGGMILTDDPEAVAWFKKARFSGRDECSYHEDDFDNDPSVIGWNFYMPVETAARGLHMMTDFPLHNEDLSLPYPDLSTFKCYQT